MLAQRPHVFTVWTVGDEPRRLTWTVLTPDGYTVDTAAQLAQETRTGHSYYTGALQVRAWVERPAETYRMPEPEVTYRWTFPEGKNQPYYPSGAVTN